VNTDRTISPLTLSLVEAMATDPKSTPQLREFHRNQLADLRARSIKQNRPRRETVFSRFEEALSTDTQKS
jgi:hypothetical protein